MYTASQGRLIGFRRPCVIYLHDLRVFYPNKLDKAGKLYYRGQDKPPSLKTRALPFIKRKQHKGDKQ